VPPSRSTILFGETFLELLSVATEGAIDGLADDKTECLVDTEVVLLPFLEPM